MKALGEVWPGTGLPLGGPLPTASVERRCSARCDGRAPGAASRNGSRASVPGSRAADDRAERLASRRRQTATGVRKVKIRPALREELASYKAGASHTGPKSFVFGTSQDQRQSSSNVRSRVLGRSVQRANQRLERRGESPLPALTPHGLRRSFASLLYAIGEPPPVGMAELGHTDPGLAMAIYAHAMRRDEHENDRLHALVNGHQWAPEPASVSDLDTTDRLDQAPDDAETRSGRGFPGTRPAGFEPATSASGGQRSIH
jgi:hypothetical protein